MIQDNIKIKIIFNGKNLTVDVPKSKPFKMLRDKIHAFFYPLPQTYSFYEKKSELNINEDKLFGEIFGARNQIILTIKETQNNSAITKNTNKSKNDLICEECSETKNEVTYFCRDCNKFICKSCRLNPEGTHYSHDIIQLFNNTDNKGVKRNIELYKQLLIGNINNVKNKINKCRNINQKKVNVNIWKNLLEEKILLIAKLLYTKKGCVENIDENKIIKDKTELDNIKQQLECIKNENNIVEINNDPLIEFNKINEFDSRLRDYKKQLELQTKNNKIERDIFNAQDKVDQLLNNFSEKSD